MINFLTKQYISRRTKELGGSVPDNYLAILQKIENTELPDGMSLRFGGLFNRGKNVNAYPLFRKYIILNPEYATKFVLYDGDNKKKSKLSKALLLTIGHELTHIEKHQEKYKQLTPFRLPLKKMKFTAWVNEAHADFGGAQKMANSSRQTLLEVMEYKKAQHPDSKDICHHPSWERRMYYVKKFDFTNELIEQIAKDVGYKNQKFIDKVKAYAYYADIILSPAPAND